MVDLDDDEEEEEFADDVVDGKDGVDPEEEGDQEGEEEGDEDDEEDDGPGLEYLQGDIEVAYEADPYAFQEGGLVNSFAQDDEEGDGEFQPPPLPPNGDDDEVDDDFDSYLDSHEEESGSNLAGGSATKRQKLQ